MTSTSSTPSSSAWTHADIPHLNERHGALLHVSATIPLDDPCLNAVFAEVERLEQILCQLNYGCPAPKKLEAKDQGVALMVA